jgi:hypothetical protein
MPTPFDFEHADPWASHFIDVESLNALITDAIVERVAAVHRAAAAGVVEPTKSLLVLGPAGTGKTHLFARVRRLSGPKATFVHIRPDLGIQTTPRHVLAHVLTSLQRETALLEATQLDVLVGTVLSTVQGRGRQQPLMHLDDYRRADASERQRLVDDILERFGALSIDASSDYLELLLRVPLADRGERQAACAWLSGREPSEAQLARLGRRSALDDTEVVPALRTLAVTAALGGPLVLVFDQLENLIDPGAPPDRILAYGTLVSELVDNVRGLTLVQMALDSEWLHGIGPRLGESQRTRVEMQTMLLDLPTAEQREILLRRWIGELPEDQRRGEFPAPFGAGEARRWCEAADMTPRALMIACRRALAGDVAPAAGSQDAESAAAEALDGCLERHWEEHLVAARAEILRAAEEGTSLSPERVASSLVAVLSLSADVTTKVRASKPATMVEVERAGCRGSILLLQQSHPRSVAAGLERAVAVAAQQAVLVVRDRALPFKPSWIVCEGRRKELMALPNSDWLDLEHEALARALAAHDFLASARSQDLAGPEGRPIEEAPARAWLTAWMASQEDPLQAAAFRLLEPPSSPPVRAEALPAPRAPAATQAAPTATAARPAAAAPVGALVCLEDLRVASLERLVQEVRRRTPDTSRAAIEGELRSATDRVRWFGSALVAITQSPAAPRAARAKERAL